MILLLLISLLSVSSYQDISRVCLALALNFFSRNMCNFVCLIVSAVLLLLMAKMFVVVHRRSASDSSILDLLVKRTSHNKVAFKRNYSFAL